MPAPGLCGDEPSRFPGQGSYPIVRIYEHMFGSANVIAAPGGSLLVHLGRRHREELFVREIARSAGLGAGPASETLRALADRHHLIRTERGRNVYYRANLGSGLVRELKVGATLADLDDLVQALIGRISLVVLFGSCATGEDTTESDIDLCIVVTEDPDGVDSRLAEHPTAAGRAVSAIVLTPDAYLALGDRDRPLADRIRRGRTVWEAVDAVSL